MLAGIITNTVFCQHASTMNERFPWNGSRNLFLQAHIPIDVVKSRIMNSREGGLYKGPLDCIWKTLRSEGPQAFFKGWLPAYLRIGPHTVISLVLVSVVPILVWHLIRMSIMWRSLGRKHAATSWY